VFAGCYIRFFNLDLQSHLSYFVFVIMNYFITPHNWIIGEIQVLTAAGMKMAIFWDAAQCSLVQIDDV
jgi:hypothetical protein